MPEEEPVQEEEEHEPVQAPPIWPDQHATYFSFVMAREDEGRRQFREFVLAANDAAKARNVELSLQTIVEDEYARSFVEAERKESARGGEHGEGARPQPPSC